MHRIYDWLIASAPPRDGMKGLRRFRLPVIVGLALLSWAVLGGLIWLAIALIPKG